MRKYHFSTVKTLSVLFVCLLLSLLFLAGCESTEPTCLHEWAEQSLAPTCTESGYERTACTLCGTIQKGTVLPPLGHSGGKATCTEPANCAVCGEPYGEAKGHKLLKASCTQPVRCQFCSYNEGEPNGHEWSDATCTKPEHCKNCPATRGEALGHVFPDPDNFFSLQVCERCSGTARQPSGTSFHDQMNGTFSEEEAETCRQKIGGLLETVGGIPAYDPALHGYDEYSSLASDYRTFEKDLNALSDTLEDLYFAYQCAYVRYYCEATDESLAAYAELTERFAKLSAAYASVLPALYRSAYREYAFHELYEIGLTEEEILAEVNYAEVISDPELAALTSEAETLSSRAQSYAQSDPRVAEDLIRLVGINRQIAEKHGAADYQSYSYEYEYGRGYTYDDLITAQKLIGDYILPVYQSLSAYRSTMPSHFGAAQTFYQTFKRQDMFTSDLAWDAVTEFFKRMTYTQNEVPFSFYYLANEMFRSGNYYLGKTPAAFTWTVPELGMPFIYMKQDPYYSLASTFVHEFGHYFNDLYTGGVGDMDLLEVHSQGDEMMFIAYLRLYVDWRFEFDLNYSDYVRACDALVIDNVLDMCHTILRGAAINEFEHYLYTTEETLDADTLRNVAGQIAASYGFPNDANYLFYTSLISPCYYISYAMSALPCLDLLSVACDIGWEGARDHYFALFTYYDDYETLMADDGVVTFPEVLEYARIHSPFSEEFYTLFYDFALSLIPEE